MTRISAGGTERILESLPSISTGPDVGGPSDIAFVDEEDFYVIVALASHPADRAALPDGLGDVAGWLLQASSDGSFTPIVDIALFEETSNPDAEYSGGEIHSNPHSLALIDGGIASVDAGGNSALMVDGDGAISLLAVTPPVEIEFAPGDDDDSTVETPDPILVSVQAVPTSVALGSDGAVYVGQLTGGPLSVGEAAVWRIGPGEQPERYATGFSNIIDIAFGPDGSLYVAEIASSSLAEVFEGQTNPIGAVLRVPPGGGEAEVVISDQRTVAPRLPTLTPGGGTVLKISP